MKGGAGRERSKVKGMTNRDLIIDILDKVEKTSDLDWVEIAEKHG